MNVILEAGVAIYVAMAVALSVWLSIFVYLWRIDSQARELRRRMNDTPEQAARPAPTATLQRQPRPQEVEVPQPELAARQGD
jgi:hypothetical protein